MEALETEVAAYLDAHRDERDDEGHALVVRNGKGRTRPAGSRARLRLSLGDEREASRATGAVYRHRPEARKARGKSPPCGPPSDRREGRSSWPTPLAYFRATSKRSRLVTLAQALTKSRTNLSLPSDWA